MLLVACGAQGGRETGGRAGEEGEEGEEGGARRWGEVAEPKMFSIHHSEQGVPMRCEFRFKAPEGFIFALAVNKHYVIKSKRRQIAMVLSHPLQGSWQTVRQLRL
eukprot:755328-Hanusia_phi.AAC.1